MENNESELRALIIRLFPPHDYGEDANVEELYNRCLDLENERDALKAEKEAKISTGKFYYEEAGSEYEIKDDKHVWGLAYGEDAAILFTESLNNKLVEAVLGIEDILHNHYGDDRDETHLFDKVFEALIPNEIDERRIDRDQLASKDAEIERLQSIISETKFALQKAIDLIDQMLMK